MTGKGGEEVEEVVRYWGGMLWDWERKGKKLKKG